MIIGFSGAKRSGKNTACEFITEEFFNRGYEVRELSFAKALKWSAAACFGIPKEQAVNWSDRFKKLGTVYIEYTDEIGFPHGIFTGREFLQNYGTEAHRDLFGQDFWVNVLLPEGFEHGSTEIITVSDVRFPNEAERIRDLGGIIVEIVRPMLENNDTHASEIPLPTELIDTQIINSDIGDFQNSVISVVEEYNANEIFEKLI